MCVCVLYHYLVCIHMQLYTYVHIYYIHYNIYIQYIHVHIMLIWLKACQWLRSFPCSLWKCWSLVAQSRAQPVKFTTITIFIMCLPHMHK